MLIEYLLILGFISILSISQLFDINSAPIGYELPQEILNNLKAEGQGYKGNRVKEMSGGNMHLILGKQGAPVYIDQSPSYLYATPYTTNSNTRPLTHISMKQYPIVQSRMILDRDYKPPSNVIEGPLVKKRKLGKKSKVVERRLEEGRFEIMKEDSKNEIEVDDLIKETISFDEMFNEINELIFSITTELLELESLNESQISKFWILLQGLINNLLF